MTFAERLSIKFYVDGVLVNSRERVFYGSKELDDIVESFLKAYAHKLHMIEVEFLDAPPQERFLRMGTDTRFMRNPLGIGLDA